VSVFIFLGLFLDIGSNNHVYRSINVFLSDLGAYVTRQEQNGTQQKNKPSPITKEAIVFFLVRISFFGSIISIHHRWMNLFFF
jgi:hypothetical protein